MSHPSNIFAQKKKDIGKKPDKLEEMQKQLTDKNMSKGLTVLLHGAPDTGKTEIVIGTLAELS